MGSTQNIVPQRQRGIGMTGLLAIMGVSVFMGMFAFKVGPHYMENLTVTSIATDLAGNATMLKKPRSKVYMHINQAYRTNNLWDLVPQDTIKLKKDGKLGYIVTVQYEKRANLFHNIDVVTSFDKVVSATAP